MKIFDRVFRWIFIISIPWLVVTAALRVPASVPYMYEYLFNTYDVSITTGLDNAALRATARGLVSYFNSGETYINLVVQKDGQPFTLFNEREIVHLKDVKDLFNLDLYVLLGTLAIAIAYVIWSFFRGESGRRLLARSSLIGGGITLGLMVLLGVGMLFKFDALLLRFHLLSFSNDFWLLDPSRDYLIMLITGGFMYDASFIVAIAAAVFAVLIGGCGWFYLRLHRQK
jgi:integral membrane protein (TIGR01906 family)